MSPVPAVPPSTKQQIVRAAERLFATHGLEGVSLRQIGAAAGNGNNSAVQYHFGSKDQLVQAIFEDRLPYLDERRRLLVAQRRPDDLRSWVECYVLPILEQGEQAGSHYLGFVAMLQQSAHREVFERIPEEARESTRLFREQVGELLAHIPEPLRTHRIAQALALSANGSGPTATTSSRSPYTSPICSTASSASSRRRSPRRPSPPSRIPTSSASPGPCFSRETSHP